MKARFNSETIDPNLPGIVVLSHGPLASALLDSAALLNMGDLQNAAAFCLEEGDDLDAYRTAFVGAMRSFPAGCLVFVDIFGGSPSNQLMIASQSEEGISEVYAVAGVNLGMLLEASLMREGITCQELHAQVVDGAAISIVDMTEKIRELVSSVEADDEEEEEDD